MKASIIFPNLNGEKWLKDCIDSCINQNFDDEYEIIVIENASTDSSMDIIRECQTRFENLHVIVNEENLGFAPAVNQGIRMSKAEYVVMFNNDAFAQPDWLAELVRVADSDPKIFSVGSVCG